jgi:HAD superfamily hydrolase (TIGR01509 family)
MWIIFDVNGVIVPNIELSVINDYCKKTKRNRLITMLHYAYLLLDYQKGLLEDEFFWQFVLGDKGYEYVKKRYSKNTYLDKQILEDIKQLKKMGYNVAILSNSSKLMSEEYKKLKFYKPADKVFLSDELHMIKPEPRIFKFVMKELKAKPSECMLIDDSWYNVLGASIMGWKVVWFKGSDDLPRIFKKIKKKEYFQQFVNKIHEKEIPKKIKKLRKRKKK